MKFLVTKDLAHSKLLSYLMAAVVFSIVLYLLLDVVLHSYVIGSDLMSIKNTLFGNLEAFEEPILIDSLLLQVHIDFFMTIFALLILSSIYIRLYEKTSFMKWLLHLLFTLGLLASIFLLLAYFYAEIFMYLWIGSFLLWHILGLVISVMVFKRLKLK
jgi:hypothetical protein